MAMSYREALAKGAVSDPRRFISMLYYNLYDLTEHQFDGSDSEELYLKHLHANECERQKLQLEYIMRTFLKDAVRCASKQKDEPFDWSSFLSHWMVDKSKA